MNSLKKKQKKMSHVTFYELLSFFIDYSHEPHFEFYTDTNGAPLGQL